MLVRARLTRLEAKLGGKSTKHYLWVCAIYGETTKAAIDRYLQARGITLADVGYLWLWGDDCCEDLTTTTTCARKT